jgi:MFS family permease
MKRGKYTKNWLLGLGGLNILLLGLVSLFNDFSSELIAPILPLLITSLGGTGLTIGLIGGMMDGMPHLLKVISGYFSDKLRNRKKFIFWGYFTSEFFKLMLLFAQSWVGVMAFMGLNKLGKGIREAPRDALISESLPNHSGKAFGIQRAFDTTGAILGSLTVLAIVFFMGLYFNGIIIAAAVIGFLSLIPLYFLKNIESVRKREVTKIGFWKGLKKLPNSLKLFLVVSAIFAFSNFSYMFFVLKSASAFGVSITKDNLFIPILLYVFFNIFYALFAIPFGKLSDEVGRRRVLLMGYLLFSLVCLGFLFFSSLLAMIFLFISYGLVYAMIVGNQRAFVSDRSPKELRATALGAFQTVIGLASIISGVIAGLLFDINSNFTFIYGAALSFLSVLIFLFFFGKMKQH